MVCLGLEPGVAEWKAQMIPLSYGGNPEGNIYEKSKKLLTAIYLSRSQVEVSFVFNLIHSH